MRKRVLGNGRYGVLEVGSDGIVVACNNKAADLLSGFCKKIPVSDLSGLDIFTLTGGNDNTSRTGMKPSEIISSLTGITLLDSFKYPDTDTEIIMFTERKPDSFTFVCLARYSSSLLFELDSELNFIFASESFFRLSGIKKTDLYGLNISCITSDKDFARFRTSIEEARDNRRDYIELNDFRFSFDAVITGYKVEVYMLTRDRDDLCGYICLIPDPALYRKCSEFDLVSGRMNEVLNFTSAVSHDCNNALTAVLGNISLAKMEIHGNGDIDELLADAESAALKIKNLAEKLSVFIRSMKP